MRKNILMILAGAGLVFSAISCKKVSVTPVGTTYIAELGDINILFDVSKVEDIAGMLKDMKADVVTDAGVTHFLILTIMDMKQQLMVKDATIEAMITSPPPAGRSTQAKAVIVEGAGMYHYLIQLKAADAGEYGFDVTLNKGALNKRASAKFVF